MRSAIAGRLVAASGVSLARSARDLRVVRDDDRLLRLFLTKATVSLRPVVAQLVARVERMQPGEARSARRGSTFEQRAIPRQSTLHANDARRCSKWGDRSRQL